MASKLAWHFQNIPGWAHTVVNSEWVKLIDPPNNNPLPGRKIIGRVYIPDNETNAMIAMGQDGAPQWWNRVAPIMTTRKYVSIWELPNEPQPVSNWTFCNQLAAFTKTAADIMHAAGLKVLGGNLSEGNPGGDTEQERANLFCAIAKGLTYCDGWSQHAYWVPETYPHKEAGYNQWHALRYQLNRQYARARGIPLPPVYLNEGGWDFGIVGVQGRKSWRSYATWDAYFASLKRFDQDLLNDKDVQCCTLFVSGANLDWLDFDIAEPESRSMAAYIPTVGAVVIPPPQPPQEQTMTIVRPLPSNRGTPTQLFGENVDKYLKYGFAGHEGLDYACPVGTNVYACTSGVVKFAGQSTGANANYGLYIVINHGEFESWYCHLSAIKVSAGTFVPQRHIIGLTGNTGNSTGPHLHFAIRVPTAKNASKGFVDPWAMRVVLGDG